MDFNIDDFTIRLMQYLKDNAPFESDEVNNSKHPNRHGLHLRDLFDSSKATISRNIDERSFEVGSPMIEELMPHYHILQNSETIRKKYRGTNRSKGSQDKEKNLGLRDYEKVSFNGKTYSKEYSKNVRGQRSKARRLLEPKLRYIQGRYEEDRRNLDNSYINIHYRYIDRTLDITTPWLAQEFGLKLLKKVDSGLKEEYQDQENEELFNTLFDMMSSYEGEEDYD